MVNLFKICFILILIVLFENVLIFADDFSIINPNIKGEPSTLCTYKNHIAYSNRVYDSNFIFLSIDKGKTWENIFKERRVYPLPNRNNIGDLKILNDSTIFFTVERGLMYFTNNNGKTWKKIIPDSTNLYSAAFDIKIINDQPFLLTYNKIMKSDDKYEKWEKFDIPIFIGDSSVVLNFQVQNDNNIMATIQDRPNKRIIYRQIDFSTLNFEDIQLPKFIDNCFFINKNVGWSWYKPPLVYDPTYPKDWNSQIIYKTVDGGKTWINKLDTNYQLYSCLRGVKFLDEKNGFAYGDFRTLLYSDDGGETWKSINKDSLIFYGIDYTFNFEIIDQNNAFFTSPKSLFFLKRNPNAVFEIDDKFDKFKIPCVTIYPNPVSAGNTLHINSENNISDINFIDLLGMEIAKYDDKNILIPVNTAPGIYFIIYRENGVLKSSKIIVE